MPPQAAPLFISGASQMRSEPQNAGKYGNEEQETQECSGVSAVTQPETTVDVEEKCF